MQEKFIDEIESFTKSVLEERELYIEEYKEEQEKKAAIQRAKDAEEAKVIEAKKKADYEKHPDYIEFWNPGLDCGLIWSKLVWNHDWSCETCGKEGCYMLSGDRNSAGVCIEHCIDSITTDKHILKVVKLPYGHEYKDGLTDAEALDEYE